jgi:hypothetical protein
MAQYNIQVRSKQSNVSLSTNGVTKDMGGPMSTTTLVNYTFPAGTSVFQDWGNDLYDNAGYFTLHRVSDGAQYALPFSTKNGADGVVYKETFSLWGGSWELYHGYLAGGFRAEIRQVSGTPVEFKTYVGGNAGADANVGYGGNFFDWTGNLTGKVRRIWYNYHSDGSGADPLAYFLIVPYNGDKMPATATSSYTSMPTSGDTWNLSTTNGDFDGYTIYFSKGNLNTTNVMADLQEVQLKTKIGTIKAKKGDGTIITLPVYDPATGVTSQALRTYLANGKIGCLDLVGTGDATASPFRIYHGGAIKAIQKE